jgi:hypothetical protein
VLHVCFLCALRLNPAEQHALSHIESLLDLIGSGKMKLECDSHIDADPERRGEHLALRLTQALIPDRKGGYDEHLPATSISTAGSSPPLLVPTRTGMSQFESSPVPVVHVVDMVSSSHSLPSPPPSALSPDDSAAKLARMEQLLAKQEERAAQQEAALKLLRAEHEAEKKKVAKLEQDAKPSPLDAGDGLAYASASAKPAPSAQQKDDANEKRIVQLQLQVDELTSLLSELHAHNEEHTGFRPKGLQSSSIAVGSGFTELEAHRQLESAKSELMRRKSTRKDRRYMSGSKEGDEDPTDLR